MRHAAFYLFFASFLMIAASAFGQEGPKKDSLQEVRISGTRGNLSTSDEKTGFTAGQQKIDFDSTLKTFYQMQPLSQLVLEQSTVFVKSYGVNGAATLSMRGASAAQNAVLWNGVPLAGTSLGSADISLLNTGLFDGVSLQYGSSSALFGTGNVGGALMIEDAPPQFRNDRKLDLSLAAGSFGQRNTQLKALYENTKLRFGGTFFYHFSDNDFPYLHSDGKTRPMENAQSEAAGGIISFDYKLGKAPDDRKHLLSLKVWYQEYLRELPPALFEALSMKVQGDRSLRTLLHWQKSMPRSNYYAKLSYIKSHLDFEDGVIFQETQNTSKQIFFEPGWKWSISHPQKNTWLKQEIIVFAPIQLGMVSHLDISDWKKQNQVALAGAYKVWDKKDRIVINATIRQELVDSKAILLPGLGLSYDFFKSNQPDHSLTSRFRANTQKTYRLPSLNELYFTPGGNPRLLPERGWSQDAGLETEWTIRLAGHSKTLLLRQETSVFNRNIKDWIYWLGGAIWTPHNLAKVHSQGLETINTLAYEHQDFKISLSVKTGYVLSITIDSYLPDDGSIGKQIPYTPRYSGQASMDLSYGSFLIHYNHIYSGYRFTTVDESAYLQPFDIGNLQLAYRFNFRQVKCGFSARLMNIANKAYFVVNERPMPGRHFLFSTNFVF